MSEEEAPKVVDECSACGGQVVESAQRRQTPVPKGGYKHTPAYWCADCGVMYVLPPAMMKKRRKAQAVEVLIEDCPLLVKALKGTKHETK